MEYQFLITTIKEFHKVEDDLQMAIQKAVELCLQQGKLSNYLMQRKSEVIDMLALEYTIEDEIRDTYNDGFNDGRLQERALTKKVFQLFLSNHSISDIATKCGISQQEVQLILE